MPRKNIDEHFEEERPEWTKRKHDLLARYVVPAAMKMRKGTGEVALIDGYAGANSYGAESTGSTVIMVGAAKAVNAQGDKAKVYACEPDKGRFKTMCTNLASEIDTGVLLARNSSHSQELDSIRNEIGNIPAILRLMRADVLEKNVELPLAAQSELRQVLEFEMDRARRFNRQVCVVMMDMDFFKSVNDGHDHLFGSFVLTEVGGIVKRTIRNIDIGARYGGDEFLIVLTEVNKEGALVFCERLRKSISTKLFKSGEDEIHLTCSIGFAITSTHDRNTDPRSLVRAADNALYRAKREGRNCVRYQELPADVVVAPKTNPKKSAG